MLECNRKFERFNLPLVVSFRPTYGATDYTVGLMKNISVGGIALEAENFSFIKYENLELNLKFPQHNNIISLSGSVIWKKQSDNKCAAGVKLKDVSGDRQAELIECMSSLGNIPVEKLQPLPEGDNAGAQQEMQEVKPRASKKKKRSSKKMRKSGYTKQYCNGGSNCKVTFRLPREAAPDAGKVAIVGDFNNWDSAGTIMKQVTRGDFMAMIELQSNREYRYKYIIDDQRWENDWYADKYIPNEFGSDDSVVIV